MNNLILNSIKKRKISSVSLLLTVIVSAALLFSVSLIFAGVNQGVHLAKERGGAEVIIVPEKAQSLMSDQALMFTGAPVTMYMPDSIAEEVASVDGVKRSSVQFFAQTLSAGCCSIGEERKIIGYDGKTDWLVQALSDVDLGSGIDDTQVIVGSNIKPTSADANTLFLGGEPHTIVTKLEKTGTDIDDCIILNMDSARKMALLAEDHQDIWFDLDPESVISTVLVDIDDELDNNDRSEVVYALEQIDGVRVIERDSVIAESISQLMDVFGIMVAAGLLMLALCLVQLFSRFYSMAWDRKSELSLYRALGASVSQVSRLIIGEALLLSGIGVVVGVVAGYGLFSVLQSWLTGLEAFPYVSPDAVQVLMCAVATIVVFAVAVMLSIIAPLRQIGRIDPSLAMQQSDID